MALQYNDDAFRKALLELAVPAMERPADRTGPLRGVRAVVKCTIQPEREGRGTTTLMAIAALLRNSIVSGLNFDRDEDSKEPRDSARVPWTPTTAGVFISTVNRADPAPAKQLRDQLEGFSQELSTTMQSWAARSGEIKSEIATEDGQIATIRAPKKMQATTPAPPADPTRADRARLRSELDALDKKAHAIDEGAKLLDASYPLLRALLLVQSAVAAVEDASHEVSVEAAGITPFPSRGTRDVLKALRESFDQAEAARRKAGSFQTF